MTAKFWCMDKDDNAVIFVHPIGVDTRITVTPFGAWGDNVVAIEKFDGGQWTIVRSQRCIDGSCWNGHSESIPTVAEAIRIING